MKQRRDKVEEIKKKTNYYSTRDLLQKYDESTAAETPVRKPQAPVQQAQGSAQGRPVNGQPVQGFATPKGHGVMPMVPGSAMPSIVGGMPQTPAATKGLDPRLASGESSFLPRLVVFNQRNEQQFCHLRIPSIHRESSGTTSSQTRSWATTIRISHPQAQDTR